MQLSHFTSRVVFCMCDFFHTENSEQTSEICFLENSLLFSIRADTSISRRSFFNREIHALTHLHFFCLFFRENCLSFYFGTICARSNLFYCSDNVDLAKRDARVLLTAFFFWEVIRKAP